METRTGPAARIDIPRESWDITEDEHGKPDHLNAWIEINGIPMHLEAFRRGRIDYETGEYLDNESLEKIAQGVEPDGPFCAFRFKGRKFVLVATPFCE